MTSATTSESSSIPAAISSRRETASGMACSPELEAGSLQHSTSQRWSGHGSRPCRRLHSHFLQSAPWPNTARLKFASLSFSSEPLNTGLRTLASPLASITPLPVPLLRPLALAQATLLSPGALTLIHRQNMLQRRAGRVGGRSRDGSSADERGAQA